MINNGINHKEAVLILGASALQVPLIKFTKAKGYFVIVVSIPGNYPGFLLADKIVYADVRDVDGIYGIVKNYNVVSILTDETDIAVPTVACLCQKFKLHGNDPEIASIYSNKFLMRETCRRIGVSIPKYFRISDVNYADEKISDIAFPAIMKPEDNQGSRGIYKVLSLEDVRCHFQESLSFSKTGNVIVEEFFKGQEVVCEGYVINGEYINWGLADRKYFDLRGLFIPCQTIFPSKIPADIKEKIIAAERKIHKELCPNFGMIHSEYLYNEETKEYILVETALRGGGVYISSHLIPYYTGYDNYELLLSCSLGKVPQTSDILSQIRNKSACYMCFYLPKGEIVHIAGITELSNRESIKVIDLDALKIGTKTEIIRNKTQRLGPIIIAAENRDELEKEIDIVKNTLVINVKTKEGQIKGICWK